MPGAKSLCGGVLCAEVHSELIGSRSILRLARHRIGPSREGLDLEIKWRSWPGDAGGRQLTRHGQRLPLASRQLVLSGFYAMHLWDLTHHNAVEQKDWDARRNNFLSYNASP